MSEEQRLNNLGIDPDLPRTNYLEYIRRLSEIEAHFTEKLKVTPLVKKDEDAEVKETEETNTVE